MIKKFLCAAALSVVSLCASAVSVADAHYEGIAKIPGQPIDFWTVVNFDDEDAMVNVGGAINFMGAYTLTGTGDNVSLSIKVPGGTTAALKSADGASSFEGSLSANGNKFTLWVLKVPAEKVAATMSDSELDAIVGSPDGYTAFVRVEMQGNKLSATSDFTLDSANHTFKMTCDSPAMQQIFGTMQGTYSVSGGQLVMTDSAGKTVYGKIYDNGNYIEVPMGSAQGMNLSLILIR